MNYTERHMLNLPEYNEQYNIDHFNENAQKVDAALAEAEDRIGASERDIETIYRGLDTRSPANSNSVFHKLFEMVYPVGSLYWSSKSTDPATLFGGTWVRIKDRFVLAAGDAYKVNETGGAASVALSAGQMPSHSHSFTPKGSVGGHAHPVNLTAAGAGTHSHERGTMEIMGMTIADWNAKQFTGAFFTENVILGRQSGDGEGVGRPAYFQASRAWTGATSNSGVHTHGVSGNTGSATPSFTGKAGTTATAGSGQAHENMPPYVVKYCWERTA